MDFCGIVNITQDMFGGLEGLQTLCDDKDVVGALGFADDFSILVILALVHALLDLLRRHRIRFFFL